MFAMLKMEAARREREQAAEDLGAMDPEPSTEYVAGAILENQWGYDQTNIDYYLVTKRSGLWLTLVKIGKRNVVEHKDRCGTSSMTGTCEPEIVQVGKAFRRKLHVRDGKETGCQIESYGWCRLWDGKPSHWTAYA